MSSESFFENIYNIIEKTVAESSIREGCHCLFILRKPQLSYIINAEKGLCGGSGISADIQEDKTMEEKNLENLKKETSGKLITERQFLDVICRDYTSVHYADLKNDIGEPLKIAPVFTDGIPVTERSGHGLGSRSIVYYVESLHGQYQFRMEEGDFVVRIIL